jgi:uncharacterized protein
MNSIYLIMFVSGVTIGFGHCIGMCGPIVVSLSLGLKEKPSLIPHLLYNVGRITTYGILGGLMGLTGAFAQTAAQLAGLQKIVMILSGALILFMGLSVTGWVPGYHFFRFSQRNPGIINKAFLKLSQFHTPLIYFPIGLILGLLPCGPVYTALIAAARFGMETNHTWQGSLYGAGLMLSFGLGTIPSLLLIGKLSDLNWLKRRKLIYQIGGLLMVIIGGYFIITGFQY